MTLLEVNATNDHDLSVTGGRWCGAELQAATIPVDMGCRSQTSQSFG